MQTTFLKTFTNTQSFENVRVFGTVDKPLFMAKDVATMLKYRDTRRAIQLHVDEEDKVFLVDSSNQDKTSLSLHPYNKQDKTLPLLSPYNERDKTSLSLHPYTVLINESGLYSLILRSRKPEAKQFKRWITNEVLPSLRKDGSYLIENNALKITEEIKTMKINNFTAITKLMERYGMDDRDVILIKNHTKMLLGNEAAVMSIPREDIECSISKRLLEKFNYRKNNHSMLTVMGKHIVDDYIKHYGERPPKRDQYVDGTIRSINHYTVGYFQQYGDKVLERVLNSYNA